MISKRIERLNARIERIDVCIARTKDKAQVKKLEGEKEVRQAELTFLELQAKNA